VREVKDVPKDLRKNGASAITVTDIRWGRCDIKTVQLLPNCLAKQQALDAGAYDAIFVTDAGVVRETTISNVFIVAAGDVITHPADHNILNGITRIMTIDCCRELDIPIIERFYTREEMFAADEVFFSGTTIEVLPVVRIDGRPIAEGTVGPISQRLYEALHAKTPK
jgi:D-alanine transaminase